jgi:transposase
VGYPSCPMRNYQLKSNTLDRFPAIAKCVAAAAKKKRTLKFFLGLDTDHAEAALSVIVDGGNPSDYDKHSREEILALMEELIKRGHGVSTVQEACGFGPYFHRQMLALGATSYMLAPENLSGKRKTDKRDARKLAQVVHDYEVHGNREGFRVVRDFGERRRQRRALSRQRGQLLKARNQLGGNGRGLMMEFGFCEVPAIWWGRRKWPKLRGQIEQQEGGKWLIGMLEPLRASVLLMHERIRELEKLLASSREPGVSRVVPKGFGDRTMDLVESEVGDWNRFKNRNQVGSYTGLCSGERSTGGKRRQGSIDRQGNAHIRKQLVEAVWRLKKWNPGWRAFAKFPHIFGQCANIGPAAKKKAVVACARMLMIDLWRLNTGQTSLENLGMV